MVFWGGRLACELRYSFMGLAYILVYVGAVSILLLFILMLINIRISELLNAITIPAAEGGTRHETPMTKLRCFVLRYGVKPDLSQSN
jgi:hypothetical protein